MKIERYIGHLSMRLFFRHECFFCREQFELRLYTPLKEEDNRFGVSLKSMPNVAPESAPLALPRLSLLHCCL